MKEKFEFIMKKLGETRQALLDIFDKMMERGLTTEEIKFKSDTLLDTSDMFKKKIIPCHKRFIEYFFRCPRWWFKF